MVEPRSDFLLSIVSSLCNVVREKIIETTGWNRAGLNTILLEAMYIFRNLIFMEHLVVLTNISHGIDIFSQKKPSHPNCNFLGNINVFKKIR